MQVVKRKGFLRTSVKKNGGDEGSSLLRVLVTKNGRSECEEPLKVVIARDWY
jgi:hypothetical protein